MRAIAKRAYGGHALTQAHLTPPATSQQATARWDNFGGRKEVLYFLLDEQYQLCCYSEIRADQEGLGYHIEHVNNKSQYPAQTFDFANLAASALDSVTGLSSFSAQGLEVFGGHAVGKRGTVDFTRFISCHQSDCRRYFAYLSDGRVVPAQGLTAVDHDRAQYTIDTLNLDSPFLVTRRQQWWNELDKLFKEHEAKGWSLPDWAHIELVPVRNDIKNLELNSFFTLTRQFFGKIAEKTLQHHAPELV